jgi:hypothetical protein
MRKNNLFVVIVNSIHFMLILYVNNLSYWSDVRALSSSCIIALSSKLESITA